MNRSSLIALAAGALLVALGAGMIYIPAGVIVAGLLIVAYTVLTLVEVGS